jgi:putative ABC transport system permease protein
MLARLYWTRLRTQPLQEALAILGIAIGVALIFTVEIANTSVPASVRGLYHELESGASLEVGARSPEGFEESLESKLGEAPGVYGAAGVLNAPITLIGPHGEAGVTLFGAQPAVAVIGGPLARRISVGELEKATPAAV